MVAPPGRAQTLRDHLERLLEPDQRLVVVSNRGPLSFKRTRAGEWRANRGSGGLVTALAEVGRLAPVTWVSAAMDTADRAARETLDQGAEASAALRKVIAAELPGQDLELRLVEVSDDAFRAHYTVVSNPFLWFLQHQLYQLPYEPRVDDRLIDAWQNGYSVVNEELGRAAAAAAGAGARPSSSLTTL